MPPCEMCGKLATTQAVVESVTFAVCNSCKSFGKEIIRPAFAVPRKQGHQTSIETLVPDFGTCIRSKREALKIDQKTFAQQLNIKESLLHNIETGHFQPALDLAKKLEKILRTKLTTTIDL